MASVVRASSAKITNDDWKMCRDWIKELRALVPGHPLYKLTNLKEFADMLQNGIVLCNVLNRIVPGSVPRQKVTTIGKSMHFSLSNIELARNAIIDKLEADPRDVFAPRDLASLDNFYKVLLTLSTISKLPQCTRLGAVPWPPEDYRMVDDEQIYGRLDEMPLSTSTHGACQSPDQLLSPDRSGSRLFSQSHTENDASDDNEIEEEALYQNLSPEGEDLYDIVVSQMTLKPQAKTKREYAIKELLHTEETYVETLKTVVMELMQKSREFIKSDLWLQLFQYLDQLYALHKAFLEEIAIQVEYALHHNKLNLYGIWRRRKREFLVYTKYVVNKPIAENAYDTIMKTDNSSKKNFDALCTKIRNMRSFSLREYLFVPIQRVLKYHLLLEAIAKNTDDEDEKKNMADSVAIVSDIQKCINEAQRDGEMLDRIQTIESTIVDMVLPTGTRLADYGRLLIDAEILVKAHSDPRPNVRFVFLFEYMLIICKIQPRQGQEYKLRDCCYVSHLEVAHLDPTSTFKPKDKFKYAFEIRKRSESGEDIENVYTMAVRSIDDRRCWIKSIHTAKTNLTPVGAMQGFHRFYYKTFSDVYECSVCGKFMAGGMFQGYECQTEYCRMACHAKCLLKAPVQPERRAEQVVALRAYSGSDPPHPRKLPTLRFIAKETITLLVRWPPDWAYGQARDGAGFFPLSFVTEKRPFPVSSFVQVQDGNFPWYVGEMTKDEAARCLRTVPSGTFLVRKSAATSQRPGEFAISLKFDPFEANGPRDAIAHVRHIRVVRLDNRFSLSQDPPFFSSLSDLVSYYRQKSLQPVFNELPSVLTYPYQASHGSDSSNILFEAVVLYDFQPTTPSELKIFVNDHVSILSTMVPGRDMGEWFQGQDRHGNVGIFPASCVRRI